MQRVLDQRQRRSAKKLTEAARRWAGVKADSFAPDADVLAALQKAGAPPEVIAKAAAVEGSGADFEIWHDNWESFVWFCDRLHSCWRYSTGLDRSARIGLDYSGAIALLRELVGKKKRRRELLADVQLMEREALAAWAEASR